MMKEASARHEQIHTCFLLKSRPKAEKCVCEYVLLHSNVTNSLFEEEV